MDFGNVPEMFVVLDPKSPRPNTELDDEIVPLWQSRP
jgi:hypothetical protein